MGMPPGMAGELAQLANQNLLSGVPPSILESMWQAEGGNPVGNTPNPHLINSDGHGGFYGLGYQQVGTTTLIDPTESSFIYQSRVAAYDFAALLQKTKGNVYAAENLYQGPQAHGQGAGVMAKNNVPEYVTGYSPSYSVDSAGQVKSFPAFTSSNPAKYSTTEAFTPGSFTYALNELLNPQLQMQDKSGNTWWGNLIGIMDGEFLVQQGLDVVGLGQVTKDLQIVGNPTNWFQLIKSFAARMAIFGVGMLILFFGLNLLTGGAALNFVMGGGMKLATI